MNEAPASSASIYSPSGTIIAASSAPEPGHEEASIDEPVDLAVRMFHKGTH